MALAIKQTRVVTVPVTELHVCQDIMSMTTLHDADGAVCGHAILPTWMPQVLEIDLTTGQIKNWQVPTVDQLQHIADAYVDGQNAKQAAKDAAEQQAAEQQALEAERRAKAIAEQAKAEQQSKLLEIEGIKLVENHQIDIEEAIAASQPALGVIETLMQIEDAIAAETTESENELDLVYVWFDISSDKWTAETDDHANHRATSTQGKFEAIKNVLKKSGRMGVYEINLAPQVTTSPVRGDFYSYDDTRTKDRTIVYVGGFEVGKGYTARTISGQRFTADCPDVALDGLLRNVLKVAVPFADIVNTTDDCTVFSDKTRYSIDMTHAIAVRDPAVKSDTVADAPEATCPPITAKYQNPETGETWTGRGKQPAWLQAKIAAGANISDFLIQ